VGVTPPADDDAATDERTASEPATGEESETASDDESVDPAAAFAALSDPRSEERRVGKECC
jgi:hypothetical protein